MMAGENRVIDLDAMGATVTALENANKAMGSHLETIVSTTNSVKSSYDGPGTEDLRISLIIVPNPATSSPPTRISRKSAIQAHCLHAK